MRHRYEVGVLFVPHNGGVLARRATPSSTRGTVWPPLDCDAVGAAEAAHGGAAACMDRRHVWC